jgi:hypothetical protein
MREHEVKWLTDLFNRSEELSPYHTVLDALVKQSVIIRHVRSDLCPIGFLYQRLFDNSASVDDAHLIMALLELPIHAHQVFIGDNSYTLGVQQWPEFCEDLKVEIKSKKIDPDEVQSFINWALLAACFTNSGQSNSTQKFSATYH